jgi:TatD DNase family protein
MRLFDTHCHLQASILAARGPGVFERAAAAGIAGFIVCSTEPGDWPTVQSLAASRTTVLPAFGVHPWYLPEGEPKTWLDPLETLLNSVPGAWVGEIGLDRTAGPPWNDRKPPSPPNWSWQDVWEDRPVSTVGALGTAWGGIWSEEPTSKYP